MAKKTVIVCDRCTARIADGEQWVVTMTPVRGVGSRGLNGHQDWCPSCVQATDAMLRETKLRVQLTS